METSSELETYSGVTASEVLDLVTGELSVALDLLTNFELHDVVADETVKGGRPGVDEGVRVAIRLGVTGAFGARLGYVVFPVKDALVLAGSLLMLPTDALSRLADKGAPDETDKEALIEAGHLIAGSLDAVFDGRFNGQVQVRFAGCQGVAPGQAPWVPGYRGEPFAVRRQLVSFGALAPFEMLLAIPV